MASDQQMQAIAMQLQSSQEQVATLSMAIDNVRAEAGRAVTELRQQLAALQNLTAGEGRNRDQSKEWTLLNVKEFSGGKFTGSKGESWKVWSKKAKIYLNIKKEGFKKILETVEDDEETRVDDRKLANLKLSWEFSVIATAKLADFLQTYCGDDALGIVEACDGNGFEAWRQLKVRYLPSGGSYEIDRMNLILQRKRCKNLDELPTAIDKLLKDIRGYSLTMGEPFPVKWKMPLLCQILPEENRKVLEQQYMLDKKLDFEVVTGLLSTHANEHRLREGRGRRDMEVDAVEPEAGAKEYTEEEWTSYVDTLTAQIEELNYMGAGKGWKGKGKGRDGSKGKGGKGKDEKGKGKGGKGKETRTCHHCQKPGHLIADCRAKKANKPKVKPGDANVGVLGDEEWEEDECSSIDMPCYCCDCENDAGELGMATEEVTETISLAAVQILEKPAEKPAEGRQDRCGGLPAPQEGHRDARAAAPATTSRRASPSPSTSTTTSTPATTASRSRLDTARPAPRLGVRSSYEALPAVMGLEEEMQLSQPDDADLLTAGSASDEEMQPLDSNSEDGEWTEDGEDSEEGEKGDPLQRPENDAWGKAKSSASTAATNSPEPRIQVEIHESCNEKIRKQQEELKIKIAKLMATTDVKVEAVTPPPGFPGAKRPAFAKKGEKKVRALARSKDLMSSFSAHRNCEGHASKECSMVEAAGSPPKQARTRDASSQTNVKLPHTQNDIIWTASHLRPIIDEDEAKGDSDTDEEGPMSKQEIKEGKSVNDIDVLGEDEGSSVSMAPVASQVSQDYELMMMMLMMMMMMITSNAVGHDEPLSTLPESKIQKIDATKRLRLRKGITIDSGAANNVMPRRMIRKKTAIRPSPSSIKGMHYIAANNGRIPNEGEFDFSFVTQEGHNETMVFQVAEVNKALGAVSYLVDNGYQVIFDKDLATDRDLSYMRHKASGRTTRYRRDRNIWVLDATVEHDKEENSEKPFHRPA